MTATATPPKPSKKQAASDIYLWQSWHWSNAYNGSLDPEAAMETLCKAEGGWKKFSKVLVAPKRKFSDDTLLAMRNLMVLPDHGQPEYWKESDWLDPTQEWVGGEIRKFATWYLQTIGEPTKYESD